MPDRAIESFHKGILGWLPRLPRLPRLLTAYPVFRFDAEVQLHFAVPYDDIPCVHLLVALTVFEELSVRRRSLATNDTFRHSKLAPH